MCICVYTHYAHIHIHSHILTYTYTHIHSHTLTYTYTHRGVVLAAVTNDGNVLRYIYTNTYRLLKYPGYILIHIY
jgi:hypothetical protein